MFKKTILALFTFGLAGMAGAVSINPMSGSTADSANTALTIPYRDASGSFDSNMGALAVSSVTVVNQMVTTLPAPTGLSIAQGTGGSLPADTWFYYKVSALNAAGETLASLEVSTKTTPTLKISSITFSSVSGATGYRIYRSLVSGSYPSASLLATGATVTSPFADNGSSTPVAGVPITAPTAAQVVIRGSYVIPYIRTLAQIQALTPAAADVGGILICSNCAIPYSIAITTGATIQGFSLVTGAEVK